MELTVIGAGPAYSDDPGAVGACYLVRDRGWAIVLDLGQGAFSRLADSPTYDTVGGAECRTD